MSSCLFERDSHLHKLLVVRVAKADSQDKIPAAQGTNFLQEFRHKAKTAQKLPFIAILSCACLADLAKVHAMVCVQLNAVESCLLAAQGCVHKGFLVALKVLPGDGGNTVFRHGGKASEHDLRKGHGPIFVDGTGYAPHAHNAGIVLKDKAIPVFVHAYHGTGFGDDKSCPAARIGLVAIHVALLHKAIQSHSPEVRHGRHNDAVFDFLSADPQGRGKTGVSTLGHRQGFVPS